jgi:hypothetical protein
MSALHPATQTFVADSPARVGADAERKPSVPVASTLESLGKRKLGGL